jgi:hypothetical protein
MHSVGASRIGGIGSVCAIVIAVLFLAPAASAATDIGSSCQANGLSSAPASRFVVQTGRAGVPVATSAPGVVTRWVVISGGQEILTEKLKVLKLVSSGFEAVGESAVETVNPNQTNEFATRISVPAGARFGAFGIKGVPYCFNPSGSESDVITTAAEDIAVNSSKPAGTEQKKLQLALTVTIEPDADGDGFGDETQDGCPGNPMVQGACPVTLPPPTTGGGGSAAGGGGAAALSLSLKAKLEGNVVAVRVTGSDRATASVSDLFRGRTVTGPKSTSVGPGLQGRVYLPLSRSMKEKLAALPRKRHLDLVIEVKGQTAAGASAATSTELALPGRKKAPKHRRAGSGQ